MVVKDTGETRQGWTDTRRGRKHRMAGSRNLIIRADQDSDVLSHHLSVMTVRNHGRQSIPDTAAEQCVLKEQNNSLIRNIQILLCCHSFLLASKMCLRNSRIKLISHLPPCRRAEYEYLVIPAASYLQLCWYSVRQQGGRVISLGILVISQISVVEMIFLECSKVGLGLGLGLMKGMVGCEEWLETKEKLAQHCIFWTKPNKKKLKLSHLSHFYFNIRNSALSFCCLLFGVLFILFILQINVAYAAST